MTSSLPLSDVIGDVMAAVRPPAASLDDLPVEILVEIASSLGCWSLLSLERVSERCRDVVALHLGQLKKVNIIEGDLATPEWKKLSRSQKVAFSVRD